MSSHLRLSTLILSTALCALTIAFWLQSQFTCTQLFWTSPTSPITPTDAYIPRYFPAPISGIKQFQLTLANSALTLTSSNLSSFTPSDDPGYTLPAGHPSTPGLILVQTPVAFAPNDSPALHFLGFGFTDNSSLQTWNSYWFIHESKLTLPFWSLTLLFFAAPFKALTDYLQARSLARIGHCPKCNYDLRASKERCPECGTPISFNSEILNPEP